MGSGEGASLLGGLADQSARSLAGPLSRWEARTCLMLSSQRRLSSESVLPEPAHRENGQDVSEREQAAIDDIVAALNTTGG
jgi:hypothetical protein